MPRCLGPRHRSRAQAPRFTGVGLSTPDQAAAPRARTLATALRCEECGAETADLSRCTCAGCGGILFARCERSLSTSRNEGIWRFANALPRVSPSSRVTLAEGSTPLLAAPRLGSELRGTQVYVKDETRNPTGTFKDRILAIAASVARDVGAHGLVCASTGNAGASTAAFASRAGLPALIVVPATAPPVKLAQAIVCGATVVRVQGSYSDAHRLARQCEEAGYLNTTTTFISPYSVEGGRTIAYEIADDLGQPPDWIAVPIGAGPLLVGLHLGFADLVAAGRCRMLPRLLAVQPEGCAPIVRAVRERAAHVSAWGTPDTLVDSLADPLDGYEREGDITLRSIQATRGSGVVVSDEETLLWLSRLAERVGVFAEPGGAAALAGAARATADGLIAPGQSVVCCVTGTGLKTPLAALDTVETRLLDVDSPEFKRLLTRPARTGGLNV